MADTGTNCGSSGPREADCHLGTLDVGESETLNLLVETKGLAQGSTLNGVVVVRSTNAPTQTSTLDDVNVVVVTGGAVGVAVPSVSVRSSMSGLSASVPGKVTLTLPATVPAPGGFASNAGKVKGPAGSRDAPAHTRFAGSRAMPAVGRRLRRRRCGD